MRADCVVIHPDDNVAVATRPLASGETVFAGAVRLLVRNKVPFGHKLAICAVPAGSHVTKYGRPIGRALQDIQQGVHVHIHNCRSERDVPQYAVDPAAVAAAWRGIDRCDITINGWPDDSGLTGYPRSHGRPGIRNHVLVLPAVQCANGVVDRISREIAGVVTIPHIYGCSQVAPDLAQTVRVLEGFATHPNVGATLLVALGCEEVPFERLAARIAESGRPSALVVIQEVGGSQAAFDRARSILREFDEELCDARRAPIDVADLLIGLECGGSDAWSGVTANPAVGRACDRLVAAGGSAILAEVTEFIGAEHLLAQQAESAEVARRIAEVVYRRERGLIERGVDLRGAQPAPGNIAGGLTTLEEKSLGAIAKGGSTLVREVIAYSHVPSRQGLLIMDTAGNDPESVTGMVAAGAQAVLFTTGRGSPSGCPIAPVVKIATNTPMFAALRDDMDVDAGSILGGEPIDSVGERILVELINVVNGQLTCAERWGHQEFAIEAVAPRV